LRAELGIPAGAFTCHTALAEGYVIEGHVPVEAIEQLFAERPDALGIVVPGMPADSPGMGGDPSTWASQGVWLISHDGELSPFEY